MDTRARNQLRTTSEARGKWGLGHQHERESSKTFTKTPLPEKQIESETSPHLFKNLVRTRLGDQRAFDGVIGTSKQDTVTALHFTFSAGV